MKKKEIKEQNENLIRQSDDYQVLFNNENKLDAPEGDEYFCLIFNKIEVDAAGESRWKNELYVHYIVEPADDQICIVVQTGCGFRMFHTWCHECDRMTMGELLLDYFRTMVDREIDGFQIFSVCERIFNEMITR